MNLIWTELAINDRMTIFDYIESENFQAALELDEIFSDAAKKIKSNPYLGKVGKIAGIREFVVHPHYFIAYEVVEKVILIHAIVHTSRLWPKSKK